MSHDAMDDSFLDAAGEPSGEGGRLFLDLGAGAGAVPVRAEVGRGKFLRSSHTAVVGFMLVLAAGGIWGMRTLGLGVRTAGADVPVDIERQVQPVIAAEKFNALMAELERGDRPVQIPPSRLSPKSPFELEAPASEVAASGPVESDAERAARLEREEAERAAAARAALVAAELGKLKVFAIVGGRTPAARINSGIVRQGDVVADLFTVAEIRDRSVVLECDGQQYELDLSGNPNRR
jgi:hypothetical protein